MNKVLHIGRYQGHRIFLKVEVQNGELSISGVVGPYANGDAWGGAGQIDMEFMHRNPADNDHRTTNPITPEEITFAHGWDREKWLDLLDVWHRWHLNHMNAGCEHQRNNPDFDTSRQIELVEYKLTTEAWRQQGNVKHDALERLVKGETVTLSDINRRIVNLKLSRTIAAGDQLPADIRGYYEEGKHETKYAGHTYPSEHPQGFLTKPCPVCGYKYGTAWRHEELPQSVIDFLESLPDANVTPAWV